MRQLGMLGLHARLLQLNVAGSAEQVAVFLLPSPVPRVVSAPRSTGQVTKH